MSQPADLAGGAARPCHVGHHGVALVGPLSAALSGSVLLCKLAESAMDSRRCDKDAWANAAIARSSAKRPGRPSLRHQFVFATNALTRTITFEVRIMELECEPRRPSLEQRSYWKTKGPKLVTAARTRLVAALRNALGEVLKPWLVKVDKNITHNQKIIKESNRVKTLNVREEKFSVNRNNLITEE